MTEAARITNRAFGQMVVRLGFATLEQVNECLQVQQKMREMGMQEPLGQILIKKGVLESQHISKVLRALGHQVHPIPGFELIKKLGQGGMGTVYKAKQLNIERTVAIKLLSSLTVEDASFVKRFYQEAKSAAQLSHPNIVMAYDVGEANGTYYFVMEYVEAAPARELIQEEKPLSETKAIDITLQTASALEYLHEHGLVHRDIKPDNILVAENGAVKLCDFGLAKSTEGLDQSLTTTGQTLGTPFYMSPEQIKGEKSLDIRSDLYSLGATLFHFATGRHVFPGATAPATMLMHVNEAPEDPRSLNPKLSEGLSAVILRLLEKKPDHRYANPTELIEDLKRVKEGKAPPHAKKTRRTRRLVVPTKSRMWLGVGVGAAALLLVVIAILAMPGPKPEPEKKKAPAPVAEKKETKKDPAADVAKANSILDQADRRMKEGEWPEARELLDSLLTRHGNLELVRNKAKEIGRNLSRCEEGIRDLQGQVDDLVLQGLAVAKPEGDWSEAYRLLKEAEALGRRVNHPGLVGIRKDMAGYRAEVDASAAAGKWKAALNARDWPEVIRWGEVLKKEHARTESYLSMEKRISTSTQAARVERSAGSLLAEIRRRSGREQIDLILRMETRYSKTATFQEVASELTTIRRRYTEANRKAMEEEAARAWKEARSEYDRLCREKDFTQAIEILQTWYNIHEGHDKEVRELIGEARKRRDAGNSRTAADLAKTASSLYRKNEVTEAYAIITKILQDFADTPTARGRTLARLRDKCRAKLGYGKTTLVRLDFEKHRPDWTPLTDAERKPSYKYVEEGYLGGGAVRLRYPTAGDEWSYLLTQMAPGIVVKTETISFWVKSADRKPSRGRFVLVEGREFELFGSEEFVVPTRWTRISINVDRDVKFLWGEKTNQFLDRDKVGALGFMQQATEAPVEFLVDLIVLEKKK